jgi:hypothetical protein
LAVDAVLMRRDVGEMFVRDLIATEQANSTLFFREICRNPSIDEWIERAFRDARAPHIRAMALECLLSAKAWWPTRKTRKVWIDRSSELYRIEAIYVARELTVDRDLGRLLEVGSADRASAVRKRVADGLIQYRSSPELGRVVDQVAAKLGVDRNVAVRGRIEYLNRKLVEEGLR